MDNSDQQPQPAIIDPQQEQFIPLQNEKKVLLNNQNNIQSQNGSMIHNQDILALYSQKFKAANSQLNSQHKKLNFTVSKEQLSLFSQCYLERTNSEDTAFLQSQEGGFPWLANSLQTDVDNGLTTPQLLEQRKSLFGSNQRNYPKYKDYCEYVWIALQDSTMRYLMFFGFLLLAFQEGFSEGDQLKTGYYDGLSIVIAVIVNGIIIGFNDWKKVRQFISISKEIDKLKKVKVKRDKEIMEIHYSEVVVGDIVELNEGGLVPADGVLVRAETPILVNEITITKKTDIKTKQTFDFCCKNAGQNIQAKNDAPSSILLGGTMIQQGTGYMLVTAVGFQTKQFELQPEIKQLLQVPTPFYNRVEKIKVELGKFGLIFAVFTLLAYIIRFIISRVTHDEWEARVHLPELIRFFIVTLTISITGIPEGMPNSVHVSASVTVKRLFKQSCLVTEITACELMASVNQIVLDKQDLFVKKFYAKSWWRGFELVDFNVLTGEIRPRDYQLQFEKVFPKAISKLFFNTAICSASAELRPVISGNPEDISVLELTEILGVNYEEVLKANPSKALFKYSEKRKRSGAVIILQQVKRLRLVEQGEADLILAECQQIVNVADGSVAALSEDQKQKIVTEIQTAKDRGYKPIALAYKDLTGQENLQFKDPQTDLWEVEKEGLTFVGFLCLQQQGVQEIKEEIQKLEEKGRIKIRFTSEDDLEPAVSQAKQYSIINDSESEIQAMKGDDFYQQIGGVVCFKCKTEICDCPTNKEASRQLKKRMRKDVIKDIEAFQKISNQIDVMYNVKQEHRLALIIGLRQLCQIVAVFGNRPQDSKILKAADVGFTYSLNSTDVVRESASVILTDNNFKQITEAVIYGRNIFDSVQKFIQFQMTANITIVLCTFIGSFVMKQEIISPIQMLWINTFIDTFGSLALATDPPSKQKVLERPPQDIFQPILTIKMLKHISAQVIYQIFVMLLFTYYGELFLPEYEDSFDQEIKTFVQNKYRQQINWKDYKYSPKSQWNEPFGENQLIVRSGRQYKYDGYTSDYFQVFDDMNSPSRHFTYIFNVYVLMQLFNLLRSRKLNDECHILGGLTRNCLFIMIFLFLIGMQILIVSVGSNSFSCYSHYGLRGNQWGVCVGFALGGIFWSWFANCIPDNSCFAFNKILSKIKPVIPSALINKLALISDTISKQFKSNKGPDNNEHNNNDQNVQNAKYEYTKKSEEENQPINKKEYQQQQASDIEANKH